MSDDPTPNDLHESAPDDLPGEPALPPGESAAPEDNAAFASAALPEESARETPPPAPAAARAEPRTRPRLQMRPAPAVAGLLLIALGAIFLWPLFSGGFILVPAAILAIAALGAVLGMIVYWGTSGRRARGSLFAALMIFLWGALTATFVLEPSADAARGWPLYGVALGFALLLTFLGDRWRDRRLLAPGIGFTVAGLAALLVTVDQLPADLLDLARQAAPWLLVVLALGLLPLAFRRAPSDSVDSVARDN